MKVTYIHHSCFTAELSNTVLVFDYYVPEQERVLEDGNLYGLPEFDIEKSIYVFVSHKHADHFDRQIFHLARKYKKIWFLLSKDIKMSSSYMDKIKVPMEARERIFYLGAGRSETFGELKVETLKSTDEGVAFLVSCEGKEIYHAGDLNWWTWIGESEEEGKDMAERFKAEIKRIEGRHFDAAFLPLDPRQEERFFWGFDYFMRHTDTSFAYPMHFWDKPSVIGRLLRLEESKPYREKIAPENFYTCNLL